jgi:putative transposase
MQIRYERLYIMNRVEARLLIVERYRELKSISSVSRELGTSRQVVRKWLRRYEEEGDKGLRDRSRRPHISPRRTASRIESLVSKLRKETGYGRRRLSWILRRDYNIHLSEDTMRHILRRLGVKKKGRPRRRFYPAHWAWEIKEPFSLAQVDTKHVLDFGALGSRRWDHYRKHKLPFYQWTFCEAKTRLRFLAYSRECTRSNGKLFATLVLAWLRGWGIDTRLVWQTDSGEEFGGKSPRTLEELQKALYEPWNAQLARIPLGRKGYNGRVERSHLTDDEEFYLPMILHWNDTDELLKSAQAWQYVYNVKRPHFGKGMGGLSPLAKLQSLDYNQLDDNFILFPVILLDDLKPLLPGNDVLTMDKVLTIQPLSAILLHVGVHGSAVGHTDI